MQKRYLSEEKIIGQIEKYISNDKINYAILIDGKWGSGKTYFIKNNIISELDKRYNEEQEKLTYKQKVKRIISKQQRLRDINKKPVYVSLYGINSISEIKNKIMLAMIKSDMIKKIIPVLDVGFDIGNELIKQNYSISDSSKKVTRILNNFYKLENIIIFFDDLERCSLDINSVLGYINQLVEHNNIKVILIADEEKIGRMNYENNIELKYITALNENIDYEEPKEKETFGNSPVANKKSNIEKLKSKSSKLFGTNVLYNEIKEKLIGETIFYRPNLENVYEVLLEKMIKDEEIKQIVIQKKENLIRIVEKFDYWNLRTLQFIFQAYETLAQTSINCVELEGHKEKFLTELFEYCVLKSLQIKQGQYTYNWDNDKEYGTVYLGNELKDFVYKNYVKGFKFVDDFLVCSYLDNDYIKSVLEKYIYLEDLQNNNPNDPIYKLQYYWLISEEKLIELIDEMAIKIDNNEYVLNLYSKIVLTLVSILKMQIHEDKIKIIIEKMEWNILNKEVKGDFDNERPGIISSREVADLYNEYIKNIKNAVNVRNEKNKNSCIKTIMESENWGHELDDYCYANKWKFFEEKKYAYCLDIDTIVENIINKNIENVYEFYYSLQKMYDSSNVKDFLLADKNKLELLKESLTEIDNVDKSKKYAINLIITYLENTINKLNAD